MWGIFFNILGTFPQHTFSSSYNYDPDSVGMLKLSWNGAMTEKLIYVATNLNAFKLIC